MAFLQTIDTETGYSLLVTEKNRSANQADSLSGSIQSLNGNFGCSDHSNGFSMKIQKTWENIKQNPKSYRGFIIKSLAILALVSFSIIALSCMLAPADKVDQIENSNFEGRTLGFIDFNNDLSGCDAGYYFLKNEQRNGKVLDANTYDTDRIYMSNYDSDNTRWKICRRSQDSTITLYSKSRKGFLDGGLTTLYVRASHDFEISDYARWNLVPAQLGRVQIVNVGRINSGSADRYLDSNSEQSSVTYPYLSPYSGSWYTYWTLVKAP